MSDWRVESGRVYEGGGLGLFSSHLIIQQHGGSIDIGEGLDGLGTAFSIRLPKRAKRATSAR
jgi:signal transduction histidine kinase